ncbi:hypothetical protein Tco_1428142 [Tanacetum coccineum]
MKRIIKEQTSYAVASSLSELELKKILMDKMEENNSIDRSDVQKNLYKALLEAYNSDKDLLSSYGEVVTLKRGRDDQDKDEEPSAGSNRGSKSPPKSSSKSVQEEEHDPRIDDLEELFHQEFDTGNDDVSLVREATDSVVELEYHLEEVFKATNDQLYWHNPTGRPYPHDLSKSLPLVPDARGRLIIPYDHFINNDLEYLKGGRSSRKYTTSITKTKATDYNHIKWIKDKIPRSTWKHAEFDESNTHVLERFYTSAGNPVKEILLKLNLPDHRKLKDGGEVKEFQRSFRHSDTERLSRSDEVLKLKNFKKDATLKLFKSTNQERYEHVGPKSQVSQDGKVH